MNMEPVLSSMLGWDKKNWVSGPKRKEPETDQVTPFAAMRNAMGGPTPRQAAADTDYNEETDEAEETLGLKISQVVGSLDSPGATEGPVEKVTLAAMEGLEIPMTAMSQLESITKGKIFEFDEDLSMGKPVYTGAKFPGAYSKQLGPGPQTRMSILPLGEGPEGNPARRDLIDSFSLPKTTGRVLQRGGLPTPPWMIPARTCTQTAPVAAPVPAKSPRMEGLVRTWETSDAEQPKADNTPQGWEETPRGRRPEGPNGTYKTSESRRKANSRYVTKRITLTQRCETLEEMDNYLQGRVEDLLGRVEELEEWCVKAQAVLQLK